MFHTGVVAAFFYLQHMSSGCSVLSDPVGTLYKEPITTCSGFKVKRFGVQNDNFVVCHEMTFFCQCVKHGHFLINWH